MDSRSPLDLRVGLLALILAASAVGCEGTPATAPAGISFSLEVCAPRAEGDQATGCRARLAGASMCLVFVPGDDPTRARRMPLAVQLGGAIEPVDDTTLNVQAGEIARASIFVFRDAIDCGALEIERMCTAADGCIARYGPVDEIMTPGATTTFDFTVDGVCQAQRPDDPGEALREICGDGIDNDCDGAVDEELRVTCSVGLGECRTEGQRQTCTDGVYACDAIPGPRQSDANCNGLDDDCDGVPDQAGDCDSCLFDNDCLSMPGMGQCVDDTCVECDPMDNAGCEAEAPVCNAATLTCGPCVNDGQCRGGVCVDGACRACDPARSRETCAETPETPICDAEGFECRPCMVGPDCEGDFCFQGRCVECDPVGNAGCEEPTFICDGNRFECRTCERNIECETRDPANPVCTDGVCAECTVGSNDGCSDPTRPVCISDPPGSAARCSPCTRDGDCSTDQCSPDGRCVGCDPQTQAGCEPLGGQPICDADEFCRPCVADFECPGDAVCSGGACRECADADARGCAEDGAEPICDGGSCRPCAADAECALRPGERELCVEGRCAPCEPETNRGCADPTPVCGEEGCRACLDDAECPGRSQCVDRVCQTCDPADNGGCTPEAPICARDGSRCEPCNADGQCPGADICVGGQCVECDPMTNRPCLADGLAPICDRATATCVACSDDASCGGLQCLPDGRCTECDPNNGDGCEADPARPICGADGVCRGCGANSDCTDAGLEPFCDVRTERCVTCVEGTNAGCDPSGTSPICQAGSQCRGCRGDECGDGLQCLANGACRGCNPDGNVGCGGDTPICQNGQCVPCVNNGQCDTRPFLYCVQGRCGECAPPAPENDGLGQGCDTDSDRPFCSVRGDCIRCGAAEQSCEDLDDGRDYCVANGQCVACNPDLDATGCNVNGGEPACDALDYTCRPCENHGECGELFCDAGRCVACAPDGNLGCDIAGVDPICYPGNPYACGGCGRDDQCDGNPNGTDCRSGSGRCGCGDDGDCTDSPYGDRCRGNGLNRRCGCAGNGDCPDGSNCAGGRCQ